MPFEVESRHMGEVLVLTGKAFADHRGYFMETYRRGPVSGNWIAGMFRTTESLVFEEGSGAGIAFPVGSPDGEIDEGDARCGVSGGS